jgi:hypothetical protein
MLAFLRALHFYHGFQDFTDGKELEQERAEETEGGGLCQKCAIPGNSSAKTPRRVTTDDGRRTSERGFRNPACAWNRAGGCFGLAGGRGKGMMCSVTSASSKLSAGKMLGRCRASKDLPVPGGPMSLILQYQ